MGRRSPASPTFAAAPSTAQPPADGALPSSSPVLLHPLRQPLAKLSHLLGDPMFVSRLNNCLRPARRDDGDGVRIYMLYTPRLG
jgi:hypothetical protein